MPPIPRTMKAIQITETGGPSILQLKDVPVPEPSASQVLVKNEFSGVNYIDTYFRTGLYPAQLPIILGREAAGTVVASQSSQVPVGTRVVYMSMGTYAQYSAVELSSVIQIPEDLSTEKAVAVYLQGLTAWTLIKEAANVQKGQWVLVHAAAGGVGLLLVQMLRSIGAKVIGTASTEEKRELAQAKGAEWTIDSSEDVVAKVKEITGGHGIDAIFDGVGQATFDADLEMIALKGHLVSFGNAVCDHHIIHLCSFFGTIFFFNFSLLLCRVRSCVGGQNGVFANKCNPWKYQSPALYRLSTSSNWVPKTSSLCVPSCTVTLLKGRTWRRIRGSCSRLWHPGNLMS